MLEMNSEWIDPNAEPLTMHELDMLEYSLKHRILATIKQQLDGHDIVDDAEKRRQYQMRIREQNK